MNKINRIIFDDCGNEHEFIGGSGSSKPAPNSVGTVEIEDEGVKQEDLDKEIQEKLDVIDESNVVTEGEIKEEWDEILRNAMNGETHEAGASEGESSGDGPSLD